MTDRVRMKVTVTGWYDAEPEYYEDGATPAEMAKTDETNVADDPGLLIELMDDFDVRIEPNVDAAETLRSWDDALGAWPG